MQESTSCPPEIEGPSCVTQSAEELAFDLDAVRIEPLEKKHNRGAFVCSHPKIQNYCRFNALKTNDLYMVRVFVACVGSSSDVVGYYYLALTSYKIKEGSEDGKHLDHQSDKKFERYDSVPAVYLGMIGVHSIYKRRGIGKLMMADAIQRTAKIAQHAGLYALTLDALDDELAAYYAENFGFERFKEGATGLEMFLPIHTILAALPTA